MRVPSFSKVMSISINTGMWKYSGQAWGSKPAHLHIYTCSSLSHYLTHFPKDPCCEICNRCNIQKKQQRRKKDRTTFAGWVEPANFADLITADHAVIAEHNPEHASKHDDKYSVVIQDCSTK